MEKKNLLSENLKSYQKLQKLSLMEFSKELDVPKSTLRAILRDGNTTLDTAIRISEHMGIGLDELVYGSRFSDKQLIIKYIEQSGRWLAALPDQKREEIAALILKLWAIIGR